MIRDDYVRWNLLSEMATTLLVLQVSLKHEQPIEHPLALLFCEKRKLDSLRDASQMHRAAWARIPDKPVVELPSEYIVSRVESLLDFVWHHVYPRGRQDERIASLKQGRKLIWPKPTPNQLGQMRPVVSYWIERHPIAQSLNSWVKIEQSLATETKDSKEKNSGGTDRKRAGRNEKPLTKHEQQISEILASDPKARSKEIARDLGLNEDEVKRSRANLRARKQRQEKKVR